MKDAAPKAEEPAPNPEQEDSPPEPKPEESSTRSALPNLPWMVEKLLQNAASLKGKLM